MYRYFQTGERVAWQPIEDGPKVLQRVRELGAKKLTILAVSEVVDDESTNVEELQHKGPLYFDIDNKDLNISISSVVELVEKLREKRVPDEAIHVFASGSKGFHVIIPAPIFSAGRAMKGLPAVYMEMAVMLYVPGMDFQVYCGGRGNSWRIANVQRDDGRYRVPVTLDELEGMTPEKYLQLTSAPRVAVQHPDIPDGAKAQGLEVLFKEAQRMAKVRHKVREPIPDAKMKAFTEVGPACISELASYSTKTDTNFNQAAMQMAVFLARSGMAESTRNSMVELMAAKAHSSKYDTVRARRNHLQGLVKYASHRSNLKFSCGGVLSTLKAGTSELCEGCQLKGEESKVGGASDDLGIEEREDGYFILGADGDARISTFCLSPVAVHIEESMNGNLSRRIGTVMEVTRGKTVLGTVMFRESGWSGRSNFIGELVGIANLSFLGTDADVQRIKHLVFRGDKEVGEVVVTHSAGIQTHRVNGRDTLVYVEPSFSMNEFGILDTHVISGAIPARPRLHDVRLPEKGEAKVKDALVALLQVNEPKSIGLVLGWYMACHLKHHLMKRYSQFPLLNLWGNASAGKTLTAVLFSWLNGTDYFGDDGVLNVTSVTEWSLINYVSSTTTVPRILDEFNRPKMNEKKYTFVSEAFKAAWNNHVMPRGTINRSQANGRGRTGAEVVEIPLSGPIVYCSEQMPMIPALNHRTIHVMMTRAGRAGRAQAFADAGAGREQLRRVGRAAMHKALTTPISWVEAKLSHYDSILPEGIVDRPRYSYAVAMMGLSFLDAVCRDIRLALSEEIAEVGQAALEGLSDSALEIAKSKHRSEVDDVMEKIAIMVALSLDGTENLLTEGKHFATVGDFLYMDAPIVHANYLRFMSRGREQVVIDRLSQFMQLIQQEPYFVTAESRGEMELAMAGERPLLKLSLPKMREKGHQTLMFTR